MVQSARVSSIDAVKDFRQTLCSFCENVNDGLTATQMDSRRILDWLLHQQPAYWGRELKERQEQVAKAQTEWHRVKMMKAQGYKVDEIEQKEALEAAKRAVREAEEKVELVRRWGRTVMQAVQEYEGRARQLADLVEGDPAPAVVFLDRIVESLDAYVRTAPPAGSAAEPARSPAVGNRSTTAAPGDSPTS